MRVGRPTTKNLKLNRQENSNNQSVHVVLNLDGHVTVAPCLSQKSNRMERNQCKCYLKQRIDAKMARNSAPGHPKAHIPIEEVTHNHN